MQPADLQHSPAAGPEQRTETANDAVPAPPILLRIGLDAAHRLGSLALLGLIIAAAMIGRLPFYWYVLPASFVIADLGLLGGFVAWMVARRRGLPTAEARNATLFCLLVTIATLVVLGLVRMEVIGG